MTVETIPLSVPSKEDELFEKLAKFLTDIAVEELQNERKLHEDS